jgi:hypothetical protein
VLTKEQKKKTDTKDDKWSTNSECLFIGSVVGIKSSLAAVEVCDGYHGYIQVKNRCPCLPMV